MKVLLIAANVAKTPYPVYPLGIGMVGKALKNVGHDVVQFDFLQNDMSLDAVSNCVLRENPDIVGVSIRNIDNVNLLNEQRYIHAVKDIVACIRKVSAARIVLGGSGYSILPEAILTESGADYGIVGEGERTMVRFVADAQRGVYPQQPILRSHKPLLSGKDIPSACYDLHLMEYYLQRGNVASVQTKRGCAHKCLYCTYPLLEGADIRCRDPEEVVNDIETLVNKYKAKMIFFTDSVFNDDTGHYLDVLYAMKKRGVIVPWTAFFKPEKMDKDVIDLMKETGLKAIELGSDAPTDTTLTGLGKSFRFENIVKCNDLFAAHGIATAHYFMFGCPGETEQSVLEGIENIIGLKKSVSFIFMGIRILPNTGLEKIAIRDGIITEGQDLLEPVYYIAPGIDRNWLEKTLTDAFKNVRHCIFPPDAKESSVQFLHKLGYTGLLWDMLIPGNKTKQ